MFFNNSLSSMGEPFSYTVAILEKEAIFPLQRGTLSLQQEELPLQ